MRRLTQDMIIFNIMFQYYANINGMMNEHDNSI